MSAIDVLDLRKLSFILIALFESSVVVSFITAMISSFGMARCRRVFTSKCRRNKKYGF